jgi:hypothetical protein
MYGTRSTGCPAAYLPLVSTAGTSTKPPAGIVYVTPVWFSIEGEGWAADQRVSVDLRSSTGMLRDTTIATADSKGNLTARLHIPWGAAAHGDRITLVPAGDTPVTFEVKLLTATADAGANTIVGVAEPDVRVGAMVITSSTGHALQTVAARDGSFSFDFTSYLDWEAGDSLRVWQWVTGSAAIQITEDSPEMTVVE